MLRKIKFITKQKAQGIVEYAIILAFVVSVALFLNDSLSSTVKGIYYDVADYLAYRTYGEYYGDWHKLSNAELAAIDNGKRLKADQEAMQSLVNNLIGLSLDEAFNEIKKFIPNINKNDLKPDANNDNNSKVFAVMDYYDHFDKDNPNQRYITLGHDRQMQAVNYLTGGQATTYAQYAADNTVQNNRTVAVDRFFYSNDMSGESSQKTITAQLHYDSSGKVDSVNIAAHQGNKDGAVIDGMNITVKGTGWRSYSVND